jgi:hypothetical protein
MCCITITQIIFSSSIIGTGIFWVMFWDITQSLKPINVTEELVVSNLKLGEPGQKRNQREAGNKQGLDYFLTLKIEMTFPSETAVDFQRTTRNYLRNDCLRFSNSMF